MADDRVVIDVELDNKKAISEYNSMAKTFGGGSSLMANSMKALTVATVAGATALGAATLKIGKDILTAYASNEQLVGGVETLFGAGGASIEEYAQKVGKSTGQVKTEYNNLMTAQKKVFDYADNAYKTAGLSANSYMETVTSFSASMVNSLGGDTKKAADYSNQAVTDMSDNANKMGTSMESIQYAYNGFAKGNFTMLDNLKLGYGGTKEEMQKLLVEAGKISGQKYDLSSFADITQAINVIQTKMGITGTTAKEAADTIEGSINSTKAAWENLLVGIGSGDADIGKLVNNLVESAGNVMKNIIPVIARIVQQLPEAVGQLASVAGKAIMDNLAKALGENASGALDGILSGFTPLITQVQQIFQAMATAGGSAFNALKPVIETVINALGQLPQVISPILTFIEELGYTLSEAFSQMDFSGIQDFISAIMPALQNFIEVIISNVKPALDNFIQAFVKLWNACQPLVSMLADTLMPALDVLGNFVGGVLKGAFNGLAGTFDILSGVIEFLTPVFQAMTDVFKAIAPVLSTIANWIGNVIGVFGGFGTAGNVLKEIMSGAWNGIKAVVSTSIDIVKGLINGVKAVFTSFGSAGNALKSTMSAVWSNITGAVRNAGSGIRGIIDGIKNIFNSLKSIDLSGAGRAIMNGFIGGLKGVWESGKKFISGIGSWIQEHKGPISYDKVLLIPAGEAIMGGFNEALMSRFKAVQENVGNMARTLQSTFDNAMPDISNDLNGTALTYAGEVAVKGDKTNSTLNDKIEALVKRVEELTQAKQKIIINGRELMEVTYDDRKKVDSSNDNRKALMGLPT